LSASILPIEPGYGSKREREKNKMKKEGPGEGMERIKDRRGDMGEGDVCKRVEGRVVTEVAGYAETRF
jgi:hypothetical protein